MQDKTTDLARSSAQVWQKIIKKKTKILRRNTTCEIPIMLEGEGLEEVESFRYLGSIVDTRGGTEADVKTRISKASAAFVWGEMCGSPGQSAKQRKSVCSTHM